MSVAFVFPGQGSQSVGMLDGIAHLPIVQQTLAEASAVLGLDMARGIAEGPRSWLDHPVNTQLALLTADIALYRAWQAAAGDPPAWVAGHSLGEYAALVVAEVLTFEAALALVRIRAVAMESAAPEPLGAMAAVLGLDLATLQQVCQLAAEAEGQTVSPASFNSPEQTVIAGHRQAVAHACLLAMEKGARRTVPLAVAVPSHSPLMAAAADTLAVALASVSLATPQIPLLHNVDVQRHLEEADIREALKQQLIGPVRWVETIQALKRNGVTLFVECGPGSVLRGLGRRIAPEAQHIALHSLADHDALRVQLNALRCSDLVSA